MHAEIFVTLQTLLQRGKMNSAGGCVYRVE